MLPLILVMHGTLSLYYGMCQIQKPLTSSAFLQARDLQDDTQVASCGALQLSFGATQPPKSPMAVSISASSSGNSGICSAPNDSISVQWTPSDRWRIDVKVYQLKQCTGRLLGMQFSGHEEHIWSFILLSGLFGFILAPVRVVIIG